MLLDVINDKAKKLLEDMRDNPHVAADEMIRRLTYVDGEYSNNSNAVNAALELTELADNGGDKNSTRLWWDAK